jgi:hypothetical protein
MKRGKPWSRGDKIAFGSLLATILSVFIALLFPEVRIWLHLEKKPAPPAVAPKFEPLPAVRSAEPTPTLAPKPTVNQHSKAVLKGNHNVAGNNVVGNGNMVGNDNPVAVAPNGIANAAPNFGNQSVINTTPPLPHVTWTQEQLKPGIGLDTSEIAALTPEYVRKLQLRKGNPGVMVKLSVDGPFTNAVFAAICDKPCEGIEAGVGNGMSSVGQGNASDRAAVIRVAMPGTVNVGETVTWEVRSETADPITIKEVQPIK